MSKNVSIDFLNKTLSDLEEELDSNSESQNDILNKISNLEQDLEDLEEQGKILRLLIDYSNMLKEGMQNKPSSPVVDKKEILKGVGFDEKEVKEEDPWDLDSEEYEFLMNIKVNGESILRNYDKIWAVNTLDSVLSINERYWHITLEVSKKAVLITDLAGADLLRNSDDIQTFVRNGALVLMTSEQVSVYNNILQKSLKDKVKDFYFVSEEMVEKAIWSALRKSSYKTGSGDSVFYQRAFCDELEKMLDEGVSLDADFVEFILDSNSLVTKATENAGFWKIVS